MRRRLTRVLGILPLFLLSLGSTPTALAETQEEEMARIQRQLNQEVMSQPFLAEQPEKVQAYIDQASKAGVVPPEYQGRYWRPGYTCRDLLRYNWTEYRNCRYYYHYHGRYYR